MVKSPLTNHVVDFGTRKSNPRNQKILGITPHHMAARQLGDDCARGHLNSPRQASANYYIGYDGQITIGISEDRRAWTSDSRTNDYSHITIEVSDQDTSWAIPDKAYKSLVNLCADICKRYDIDLKYEPSKGAKSTLTTHDMFKNTLCPGPYLKNKIASGEFERDVKRAMGAELKPQPTADVLYRVQVGAFKNLGYATELQKELDSVDFDTYLVQGSDGLYKVQCGAFESKQRAEALASQIKEVGFEDTYITTKSGTAVKDYTGKKSITELAEEVIRGEWGNDPQRRIALTKAGYDAKAVQKRVDELM